MDKTIEIGQCFFCEGIATDYRSPFSSLVTGKILNNRQFDICVDCKILDSGLERLSFFNKEACILQAALRKGMVSISEFKEIRDRILYEYGHEKKINKKLKDEESEFKINTLKNKYLTNQHG